MLPLFIFTLLAASSAALLFLTLLFVKAQICPGQTKRLVQTLLCILGLLLPCIFLLDGLVQGMSLLSFAALAVFFVRHRKKQNSKNILSLYAASASLLISFVALLFTLPWQQNLLLFCQFFLLGACLSHWLLVQAKSRLQAFHRLLPICGIISAMAMTILLALVATNGSPQQVVQSLLFALGLMLVGVAFWVVPFIKNKAVNAWHLHCVLLLQFSASVAALSLAN